MRTVFLDTVGLVALWDDRDQWHEQAEAAYQTLLAENAVMLTTDAVLLECGNAMSRMRQRPVVAILRRGMMDRGRLIVPEPQDTAEAWAAYEKGGVGSAGIVDHISFQVMRRIGIFEAFTNDQHFRAIGFATLF